MSMIPLATFTQLNDRVSIYRPQPRNESSDSTAPASHQPALILVCSWVGAAAKHVDKYTMAHQRLYPHATILLVQSRLRDLFVKHPSLSPADEILESFALNKDSSPNTSPGSVVLHAFSNGGARTATLLATTFALKTGHGPFSALILDCCPGRPEIASVTQATTLQLPDRFFARQIAWYIVYFTVVLFIIYLRIMQEEDSATLFRRKLNDARIVDTAVPRVYLYSKRDVLVRAEHVHEHAEAARGAGFRVVREEVFETAPHCALVGEDRGRYWGAVRKVIALGNET